MLGKAACALNCQETIRKLTFGKNVARFVKLFDGEDNCGSTSTPVCVYGGKNVLSERHFSDNGVWYRTPQHCMVWPRPLQLLPHEISSRSASHCVQRPNPDS